MSESCVASEPCCAISERKGSCGILNDNRNQPSQTISLRHSIGELPQAHWDAAIGATPSAQHGSLKTYEATNTLAAEPHYFVLGSEYQPKVVGVGYLARNNEQYARISRPLLGRAKLLSPVVPGILGPTLIIGLRPMYGPALLADARQTPETQCSNLHEACGLLEDWADDNGVTLTLVGLTDHDRQLMDVLRQREFGETIGYPVSELDVRWDSWDGYLKKLRRGRRTTVRRESNTFARSEFEIRRLTAGELVPRECFNLIRQHQLRRNNKAPPYRPTLLQELRKNLPDNSLMYVVEHEKEIVGFVGFVLKETVAAAAYIGIESSVRASNQFVYFNLAFYQLARDAPSLGIKRIMYGTTVYQGKSLRGCKVMPTRIFIRPCRTLSKIASRKALEFHRKWCDQKFQHLYTSGLG